jgi:hypothetical protein
MDQENIFQVHMPEVDIRPDLKAIFQEARELADQETVLADGTHQRRVVIVSPGRLILLKDSYPPIPALRESYGTGRSASIGKTVEDRGDRLYLSRSITG